MQSFHEVGISLDDLLSKLGNLIQVIDVNGNILYANDTWFEHLGYAEDDLPSLNFHQHIVPAPFRSIFQLALARLNDEKSVENVNIILNSLSGDEMLVDGKMIARRSEGILESIICFFHPVTHHHAHTELERMFIMSVDMLGIADFEGNFISLNPAWERVLGYSLDEMIGQ